MREAKLKQGGQMAWLVIAGILLWAFVLRDKVKKGEDGGNGGGGSVGGLEIRGLTTSTEKDSPLTVTQINFEYRSPRECDLVFAIAAKPDVGTLGTDFNNGRNAVSGFWFAHLFSVGPAANWTRRTEPVNRTMTEPTAGDYALLGGGTGTFHEGMADVWVWLSNRTAFREEMGRGMAYFEDYANEKYIVVIDTDADVLPVHSAGLELSGLVVSYL